jgi:hypothetical protein
MLIADTLNKDEVFIDGKWVCCKPIKQPLLMRIKDAIKVIKGEAEAVKFYKQ